MTEQVPAAVGTVAQEAARLIEDMATMARSSYRRADDPIPYAGEPAQEDASRDARGEAGPAENPMTQDDPAENHGPPDHGPAGGRQSQRQAAEDSGATDEASGAACSQCGAEPGHTSDGIPSTCKLCPLCRGVALLRTVRPETVDLLADLALSVAASLREVATRSRESDPRPPSSSSSAPSAKASARSSTDGAPGPSRATVQDIPVADESGG